MSQLCNRCNKMLEEKLFNKRKSGEYLASCIKCNKRIAANKYKNTKAKLDGNDKKCVSCFQNLDDSLFKKTKRGLSSTCLKCLKFVQERKTEKLKNFNAEEKTCSRCLILKKNEFFEKNTKGVLRKQCVECCNISKNRQKNDIISKRQADLIDPLKIKCNKCCMEKNLSDFKQKNGKPIKQCIECNNKMLDYLDKNRCIHNKMNKAACKHCNVGGHLRQIVTDRVRSALRTCKSKKSIEYLGCDIQTYKNYIQEKFKDGMTWENYGIIWNIDHIIPIAYKNPTLDEIVKRLHYTNTQPLNISENSKKGNRYIG